MRLGVYFICLILMACGGKSTPASSGPFSATVSWSANREKDVNKAGGGYRVYYSTTSGFDLDTASYIDVPFVSGRVAPTTATLTALSAGTYYIKVVAYSAQVGPSGGTNTLGDPSAEVSLVLP